MSKGPNPKIWWDWSVNSVIICNLGAEWYWFVDSSIIVRLERPLFCDHRINRHWITNLKARHWWIDQRAIWSTDILTAEFNSLIQSLTLILYPICDAHQEAFLCYELTPGTSLPVKFIPHFVVVFIINTLQDRWYCKQRPVLMFKTVSKSVVKECINSSLEVLAIVKRIQKRI